MTANAGALLLAAEDYKPAPLWLWLLTFALAPLLIAADIFLVGRLHPRMGPLAAFIWTTVWFVAGLAFALPIAAAAGTDYGIKYSTGYLVEKALTIDQVFVIALIIRTWKTPMATAQRLIFLALWIGLVLRLPFIALGYLLAENDSAILHYVMAALFVAGGVFLLRTRSRHPDPHAQLGVRLISRIHPVLPEFDGNHLTVKRNGTKMYTLAGVVFFSLLFADLYFDSTVPLAFAFTKPPYIVLASSTFALFGIRSMYAFATAIHLDLVLLKVTLALALFLVAADLIVSNYVEHPSGLVPAFVMLIVATPMAYGWIKRPKESHDEHHAHALHLGDD